MKKLSLFLCSLVLYFSSFSQAVYIPSKGSVTAKPIAPSAGVPTDARSYFYDSLNFRWRPYLSAAEVLSFLNSQALRRGHFPVIINTGGTLLNGVITGGTNDEYWFKDGLTNADLVKKGAAASGTVAELTAMNTTTGSVYTSTDRGGADWVDRGLNDNTHINDGALFIITKNQHYLERLYSGKADSKWFLNFAAAVASNVDLLISNEVTVNSNISIPETMSIEFGSGGSLKIAAGITVDIHSPMIANQRQYIFKGLGTAKLYSSSGSTSSVCWYGARGDSTFNSTPFIQKTFNSTDYLMKVHFPGFGYNSPYRVEKTIQVYSAAWGFISYEIYGDMIQEQGVDALSTRIIYTDTAFSVFNIRGARNVDIHHISFYGRNTAPEDFDYSSPLVRNQASWVTPGISTHVYNHLAAITFDGVGSPVNFLSQISKVRNCYIRGFVVGVSTSAMGQQQGDNIHVIDNQFYFNTYAISIGEGNNRAIQIDRNVIFKFFRAITNHRFGSMKGSKFSMNGNQVTDGFEVFDVVGNFGGNSNIDGLYAENMVRIGFFGLGVGSVSTFTLTGCHFHFLDSKFTDEPADLKLWAPFYTAEASGVVNFNGGEIQTKRKFLAFATEQAKNNRFVFNGTVFYGDLLEDIVGNQEYGMEFNNCSFTAAVRADYNKTIYMDLGGPGRKVIGYGSEFLLSQKSDESDPGNPMGYLFDKNQLIGRKINNKQQVLTSALTSLGGGNYSWASASDALLRNFMQNDLVYSYLNSDSINTGNYSYGVAPSFRVAAIDYAARTLTLSKLSYESVLGSEFYLKHSYTLFAVPITGDVVNGSPVVNNVVNGSQMITGDFVTFGDGQYSPYRVLSVSGNTVTLTRAYTDATASGVQISSATHYSVEQLAKTGTSVSGLTAQQAYDRVISSGEFQYLPKYNSDGKLTSSGLSDDGTYLNIGRAIAGGNLPIDNTPTALPIVSVDGFWARANDIIRRQTLLDSLAAIRANSFTEIDPHSISKEDLGGRVIEDANNVTVNDFYFLSGGNKPATAVDGALLNYQYNPNYQVQMFGDWRNGNWFSRGKTGGGAFSNWRKFVMYDNLTDSLNTRFNITAFTLRSANGTGYSLFTSPDANSGLFKNFNITGAGVTVSANNDSTLNFKVGVSVQTVTSSATVTPDVNFDNGVKILSQSVPLTLANPTGTPQSFQRITFRIRDNGTPQSITYGNQYRAIGVTLPTTTVAGQLLYMEAIANLDEGVGVTRWDIYEVHQQGAVQTP